LCRLAHLGPRCSGEQGYRQCEGLCPLDAADEVHPGEDVPPLIVAAYLQPAAVGPVEMEIVVGLQQLVVELQEGKARVEAGAIGLGCQHAVDRKVPADLPQKVDVAQIAQPIRVVEHQGTTAAQVDEAPDLRLQRREVGRDLLLAQQLAHLAASGRVANHARASADQEDRAVSLPLQVGERHDRAQVPDVQARRRGVVSHVAGQRLGHGGPQPLS